MFKSSQEGFRRFVWLVGALSIFALSACGGGYGGGHRSGYDGYGDRGHAQERREVARQAYERDLEQRVEAALRADPRIGGRGLNVTAVGDGVVQINGSPKDIFGRDLALRAASRVSGVRSVINNMTMN